VIASTFVDQQSANSLHFDPALQILRRSQRSSPRESLTAYSSGQRRLGRGVAVSITPRSRNSEI
jgi:hypothetical protein